MSDIVINEEINAANIEAFKKWIPFRDEAMLYKCSVCEEKTNLSGAISNEGHKLLCLRCARDNFWDKELKDVDIVACKRWMRKD